MDQKYQLFHGIRRSLVGGSRTPRKGKLVGCPLRWIANIKEEIDVIKDQEVRSQTLRKSVR